MFNIYAHRGASGAYPENTMISFKKGAEYGATGIELDVQLTRDNHVVVIHDETIDRTTNGKGWVSQYTYEELKNFDASYKFKKKVGFCSIPLLEEVLQWLKATQLNVNIELKNNLLPYVGLEEGVINLIRFYELEQRTVISSFHHDSVERIKYLASDIEVALLIHYKMTEPWKYAKRLGIKTIHPNYKLVDREMATMCKKHQINLRPYTVNNPQDIKRMIYYGCQAIITDYPERVVNLTK